MPITREELVDQLAIHTHASLAQILSLAGLTPDADASPRQLAQRIARQLWWSYATPIGLAARRITLDEIVDHLAGRLRVAGALSPADDATARLRALTGLMVRREGELRLSDLDDDAQRRLVRSWWPTLGLASGAGSSLGAGVAGRGVLWVAGTRVGQWLPYLPTVGGWAKRAYKVGGVAATLGGPVGIALSVLATNDALGTRYERLVPLAFGIGALPPIQLTEAQTVAPVAAER